MNDVEKQRFEDLVYQLSKLRKELKDLENRVECLEEK